MNNGGVANRIRIIVNSPPNLDAEGSDELYSQEVQVVPNSARSQFSTSPSQPAAKRFQSQVIPSTPRNFQPVLSTIPSSIFPPSPSPALVSTVRTSPIPQPRNCPIVTSQQLQPVASSSTSREDGSSFLFPATQVFQQRECWPTRVTREGQNMENEGQDSVARLFRRADRNIRVVIMYANDRKIPDNSSEGMASKFTSNEDEFDNDFQKTFYDWGRDNKFPCSCLYLVWLLSPLL
ncbi:hypothetical protein O181_106601 [Austropuccinia psidii MF-1]|uniref:Uncharacterized protein n=1 Tax=Austropuccinia psidii MF-1 TaxID=1389203 RepID=A0A9Q3PND6_9BASI|nr:hypothetical protein [Austropuccinia psidii MF-1]